MYISLWKTFCGQCQTQTWAFWEYQRCFTGSLWGSFQSWEAHHSCSPLQPAPHLPRGCGARWGQQALDFLRAAWRAPPPSCPPVLSGLSSVSPPLWGSPRLLPDQVGSGAPVFSRALCFLLQQHFSHFTGTVYASEAAYSSCVWDQLLFQHTSGIWDACWMTPNPVFLVPRVDLVRASMK